MSIRTLAEADAALLEYVSETPRMTGRDTKLERVRRLMELIGNPQDKLRIIHIAGTSGKTSTAYYMAALLRSSGQKVGLTVSPHIEGVNERVQIDGLPLPETVFGSELAEFLELATKAEQKPSYFELLFAFALWVFVRQHVDYAVIETGIGGLLDATNVASRQDKVCIITDIGLDHTDVLGRTLQEIAAQKLGIVHERNHVFMYGQDEGIMDAAQKAATEKYAKLHVLDNRRKAPDHLNGYQLRNWLLAFNTYRYICERDDLKSAVDELLEQTQKVTIPGRMDMRKIQNKTIVMDGAHNRQKMAAFIESFRELYPGVKPAVLLSMKKEKDYESVVQLLVPFASRIIVTTFDLSQDSHLVSMSSEVLVAALKGGGAENVESVPDQHKAFTALLAAPEDICVVTGSFYLISQLRNNEKL